MPRLALPSPRHSSTEPVLTALEAGVPTWPIEPDSRQQKETGCEERRPDRPGNGYPSPPMSESASPPHRVLRAIPEDAQSPPFSREHSSADFILPPSSRTFNPSSSAHVGPTLPSISEITRERRQHSAPPGSHPFASKYRRALLDEPVGLRTSSASPNRHHDAHKHPISPSSPYSANVAWQNAPSIIQPPWKNARSPRRAKSHVASACVNCKRAHLSCDVQRPCTRCVGSGRQDTCHDVQHKKRGRPKLKEDRTEAGWESRKKTSQQPSEPGGDHISAAGPSSSRLSLKSSRSAELASEVWSATSTASPASPESYTSKKPSSLFSSASPEFLTKRISSNSARPFALIDLGFKVLKTSRSFQTLIDTSSDLRGLRLASLLGTQQDQDVAQLLQCQIMDERTEKEPGYRAPNYSMGEQEAVKSVTVSDIATVTQDYTSREVALSFNMPGGQRQSFDCTFRLARTNIFFIVLLLPPQVVFATAANTAASHLPSLKGTSFPPVSNVSATPRRELSSVIVSGSGPSSSQYRLNARPMSIPSPPITSGHAGPSRASQTPPPAGSYGRGYRAYNEVESSSSARAESASYPHIRILPLLPSSLPPLGSHESAFVASTAEIISPPSTTSVTSDTGSTKNIAGMLQTGDRATENLILPPIGSQNARKPTTAVPGFSSLTQWESGASSTKVTTAASLPLTKSARQRSVEADEDPQRQPKRQRLNIHDVLD